MKHRLLFFITLSINVFAIYSFTQAQCLTAFEDTREAGREFFYIYDNGELVQQEFQRIQSFKVGRNYVAYVDYTANFKIYFNKRTYTLQDFAPNTYHVTDHLLVYENVGNHLYVFDGKRVHNLGRIHSQLRQYAYGDSVVAFNDFLNTFHLFFNGEITSFDNRNVTQFGANENMIAFVDPNFEYKLQYNGEILTLETGSPPQSFKMHLNIAAYVDFVGDFKVFMHGEVLTLETLAPQSYEVGENMVAYVSDIDRRFMVYYNGEDIELMPIPPRHYEVKHNMIVWTDQLNHFHVFYNGNTERLATYKPPSYQIDRDIVVFEDLDSRLLGYIDGKYQEVSPETVSYYNLVNKAVLSYKVRNNVRVFCNGVNNQLY